MNLKVTVGAAVGVALLVVGAGWAGNAQLCRDFGYLSGEENAAAAALAKSDWAADNVYVDSIQPIYATELFGPSYASIHVTWPEVTATESELDSAAEILCDLHKDVRGLAIYVGLAEMQWSCSDDGAKDFEPLESHAALLRYNELILSKLANARIVSAPNNGPRQHAIELAGLTEDEFLSFLQTLSPLVVQANRENVPLDFVFSHPTLPAVDLAGEWQEEWSAFLSQSVASYATLDSFGVTAVYPVGVSKDEAQADIAELEATLPSYEYIGRAQRPTYADRLESRRCFF